jgi:hypothetical protein
MLLLCNPDQGLLLNDAGRCQSHCKTHQHPSHCPSDVPHFAAPSSETTPQGRFALLPCHSNKFIASPLKKDVAVQRVCSFG